MLLNNFKYVGTYCTDKHYFWHSYSLKWCFESLKYSNSEVVYKYDFQKKKYLLSATKFEFAPQMIDSSTIG